MAEDPKVPQPGSGQGTEAKGTEARGTRFQGGMPTPPPELGREAEDKKRAEAQAEEMRAQAQAGSGGSSSGNPVPGKDETEKTKPAAETAQDGHGPIPSVEPPDESGSGSDSDEEEEEKPKKKPTQEAEKAINLILKAKKKDLWGILGVDPGSQDSTKTVNSFKKLGCMLNPGYIAGEQTEKAFKKLLHLAKRAGFNPVPISQVRNWDGEEDLLEHDEDSMSDTGDPPGPPPSYILELYEQATPVIHALMNNPLDENALRSIKDINGMISQQNKIKGFAEDKWLVDVVALVSNYNWALKNYEDLINYPDEPEPMEKLQKLKDVVDRLVASHCYPVSWSIPADFRESAKTDAEARAKARAEAEARAKAEAKAGSAVPETPPDPKTSIPQAPNPTTAQPGTSTEPAKTVPNTTGTFYDYPWPTLKTSDGLVIFGLRQQGRIGHRADVEYRRDDGRIIRTILSGSEVGLLEVQQYEKTPGYKRLAENQPKYSSKDREDFVELLFVTESRRKSIYGNSREPCADCGVKFKWGFDILTVSSFRKVVGVNTADRLIRTVCESDGIAPPWAAEMIDESNDPRTQKRRERERRYQGRERPSPTKDPEVEHKVNELENTVQGMAKQLNMLVDMMKRMQSSGGAAAGV